MIILALSLPPALLKPCALWFRCPRPGWWLQRSSRSLVSTLWLGLQEAPPASPWRSLCSCILAVPSLTCEEGATPPWVAQSHLDKAFRRIFFHLLFPAHLGPNSQLWGWAAWCKVGLAAMTWWTCALDSSHLKVKHLVLSPSVLCPGQGPTPFIKQLKMMEMYSNWIPREKKGRIY